MPAGSIGTVQLMDVALKIVTGVQAVAPSFTVTVSFVNPVPVKLSSKPPVLVPCAGTIVSTVVGTAFTPNAVQSRLALRPQPLSVPVTAVTAMRVLNRLNIIIYILLK